MICIFFGFDICRRLFHEYPNAPLLSLSTMRDVVFCVGDIGLPDFTVVVCGWTSISALSDLVFVLTDISFSGVATLSVLSVATGFVDLACLNFARRRPPAEPPCVVGIAESGS